MSYPFILSPNIVTILAKGVHYSFDKTHPLFANLKDRLSMPSNLIDWDEIDSLLETNEKVLNYTGNKIFVKDNIFFYKSYNGTILKLANNSITYRILEMNSHGMNIQPMLNFLDKLVKNPNQTAIDELFLFLSDCSLPITDDGNFLAYKVVNKDYKDLFTNTIPNKIGYTVLMDRKKVNKDRNQTCSVGLHFCSAGYLDEIENTHVMIVSVDPSDVVAIPNDYDNMKGRCCKYNVVAEVKEDYDEIDCYIHKTPDVIGYVLEEEPNKVYKENPYENTKSDVSNVETKYDDIKIDFIGRVHDFLSKYKVSDRVANKNYLLKTPQGLKVYRFIDKTSKDNFKFIGYLNDLIKNEQEKTLLLDESVSLPVVDKKVKKIKEEKKQKQEEKIDPSRIGVFGKILKYPRRILTYPDKIKVEKTNRFIDGKRVYVYEGTVRVFIRRCDKKLFSLDAVYEIINDRFISHYIFKDKLTKDCFIKIDSVNKE